MNKKIYTKSTPEVLNPQEVLPMKMFYSLKEASKVTGLPERELLALTQKGVFSEFRDRDRLCFKAEQIELFKDNNLNKELGIVEVDRSIDVFVGDSPSSKKDHLGTIMVASWILCGVITLVGVFAKRIYLLETVVPVLALVGFVLIGFFLVRHFKEKNRAKIEEKNKLETEDLIRQAERLQKMNERE